MANEAKKNWSGGGIVDRDLGWSKMIDLFAVAGGLTGEIGIIRKKTYADGTSVALVMALIEAFYGTVTRSVEEVQNRWPVFVADLADGIIDGTTDPEDVLETFLQWATGRVKQKLLDEKHVDTGLLAASQNYKIRKKR